MYTYTQQRPHGAHAGYASPSAAGKHVPRMSVFAGESPALAMGRPDRGAALRGPWHAALQGSPNAGSARAQATSTLRSSQECLGATREDERLHQIYDVPVNNAMLKSSPSSQALSYARVPSAFGMGNNMPTRGHTISQASPQSSYASPSSPSPARAHHDISTYGRSEWVGDTKYRNGESTVRSTNRWQGNEHTVTHTAVTHTAHRRMASEESTKADGPATPRVLVLTPRGSAQSRPLESVHRTTGSTAAADCGPSSSHAKSRPFMTRTDPITGGSVSNRTQTVLEALELLTMSSAQIKRDTQSFTESKQDSACGDADAGGHGQGPNSGSASRAAFPKNMGASVRRDGTGPCRRLSLPPSPTTSVGKGSGPDEDSNPYINVIEEVLAEPCGSSPQSQSDSEVPLNPVVAPSRLTAHAVMRPHVPPLRLPPPPSFESAQSASNADHSQDSDAPASGEENDPEAKPYESASARERYEDSTLEPENRHVPRSCSEIEISKDMPVELHTHMTPESLQYPMPNVPQQGVLRVSEDDALLRELDAGAHNAKTLQNLNSVLGQLQASHIEIDVLRAEVKKGREMGKQLREERDTSSQSRDSIFHELQASKAEIDRLLRIKAEAQESDLPNVSKAGEGERTNEMDEVGHGVSSKPAAGDDVAANDCPECEVLKHEYSCLRQKFATREVHVKEQIEMLSAKFEASEAKLAGVEAQSQTRIQQLDADVERMKAEIDATSRKWQESMQQLQMVSDELEATKSDLEIAKRHLANTSTELENTMADLVEAQIQLKRKTTESDLKSGIAWKQDIDLEGKTNELRAAKQRISALEARLASERVLHLETDLASCRAELEISRRCNLRESLENISALPSITIRPVTKDYMVSEDGAPAAVRDDGKMLIGHFSNQQSASPPPASPPADTDSNFDVSKGTSREWKTSPDGQSLSTSKPEDSGKSPGVPSSSISSQRLPTPNRGTPNRAPTPDLVEADTTVTRRSPSPYFLALHGRSTPIKMRGKVPSSAYTVTPPPPDLISTGVSERSSSRDKLLTPPGKSIMPTLDLPRPPLTSPISSKSVSSWPGRDSANGGGNLDIQENSVLSSDAKDQAVVPFAKESSYNALQSGLRTFSNSNVAKNVNMYDKLDQEASKVGSPAYMYSNLADDRSMDAPPGVPFRLAPSPARFEPTTSAHHEGYDEALLGPTPRTLPPNPHDGAQIQTSPTEGSRRVRPEEILSPSRIPDLIYNLGRSSVVEKRDSAGSRGPYNGRAVSLQQDDTRDRYGAGYDRRHVGSDMEATRPTPRSARPASSVASPYQAPMSPSIQNSSIHSRHARGSASAGAGTRETDARRGGRATSLSSSDIYVSDRSFLC